MVGPVQGKRTVRKVDLYRRRMYFKTSKRFLAAQMREAGQHGCSVPGCMRTDLEIHHNLPLAMGGTNHVDNLMFFCHDHHVELHSSEDSE